MKKFKNSFKGRMPGDFIAEELEILDYNQRRFALRIKIPRQTLSAIIKGRIKISLKVALNLESHLGLEEGFLSQMQIFYDIESLKNNQSN